MGITVTLWIYLHFTQLQLDSTFCEASEQPVVIVDASDNRIVQVCNKARAQGVDVGLGLGAAAALCQHLQVQPYDCMFEKNKLKEIAHSLYQVTCDISFVSHNGILLRVSNMLNLYQGLEAYWQCIQAVLQRLKVCYSYASGYSPLAARLLAKNKVNLITDDSSMLLHQVKSHALYESDLPSTISEQLTRVGVHTFEALLNIPMAQLAKRFDAQLVHYVGRLLGQFKEPVNFYQPPESFSRYVELLFEAENTAWLSKPLHTLLHQLEDFLLGREKVAYQLTIELQHRGKTPAILHVYAKEGEYRAEKWLMLCELVFSNHQLTAPVQGITLSAQRIAERQSGCGDLFEKQYKGGSAASLISILQAKLGGDAIQGVEVYADHRPEKASGFIEPLCHGNDVPREPSLVRPTMLLNPEPLNSKIHIQQGPERISTGWWDAQPIIRDYFVVKEQSGRWLWVFRDPTQNWYIHGVFH